MAAFVIPALRMGGWVGWIQVRAEGGGHKSTLEYLQGDMCTVAGRGYSAKVALAHLKADLGPGR